MASGPAFVQAPFARATPAQQQLGSCRLHTSTFLGPAARLRPALLRAAPARRVRRAPPTAALPAIVAGVAASAANIAPVGVSIAILGSVITWHEFGHLQAAKLQGIRVKNFSIGFGPTLFEREGKDGTTYTLRLLPLGGFVAFPDNKMVDEKTGEVTEALDDDPNLLQNRPLLDRAIVISAGVIANLVMAYAALLISTGVVGSTVFNMSPGVVIASVVDAGGPAAKANIQPGDVVLAVDGESVESSLESATTVAGKIRSSGGRTMSFHLLRDGKEFDKRVNPNVLANGDSVVGVQLVPNGKPSRERPSSVPMALRRTNEDFVRVWRQTWSGMKSIVTNFGESSRNLSGPIGVVATGANLASNEKASLLSFLAVISINVALLNSIPFIPALDGGQMTFLLIEFLRGGKAVPSRVQEAANSAAFLLIVALSGLIFLNDIEKLSAVESVTRILFG